jgi:predicted transcriptional regulator
MQGPPNTSDQFNARLKALAQAQGTTVQAILRQAIQNLIQPDKTKPTEQGSARD